MAAQSPPIMSLNPSHLSRSQLYSDEKCSIDWKRKKLIE